MFLTFKCLYWMEADIHSLGKPPSSNSRSKDFANFIVLFCCEEDYVSYAASAASRIRFWCVGVSVVLDWIGGGRYIPTLDTQ